MNKVHQHQGVISYDFNVRSHRPRIVALSGKLQSGKDTSRRMLSHIITYAIHPDNIRRLEFDAIDDWDSTGFYVQGMCGNELWQHISFAWNVKAIASILVYGRIDPFVFTEECKNKQIDTKAWSDRTWREMFVWVGTDVFRHKDPRTWLKSIDSKLDAMVRENANCFITDCRFRNEADFLVHERSDALLIRIDRNEELIDPEDPTVPASKKNESETGLDLYQSFHEVVLNHTNKFDLYVKLYHIALKYNLIK